MSSSKDAMKRRYAALMMAELAWRDDLVFEDKATQARTRVTDGQVTIHIRKSRGGEVRIWPSIVLRCRMTGQEVKLVRAVGLAPFPAWTRLELGGAYTLLFPPLPDECPAFDLLEDIPEPGGLIVRNIVRNASDVYRLGDHYTTRP